MCRVKHQKLNYKFKLTKSHPAYTIHKLHLPSGFNMGKVKVCLEFEVDDRLLALLKTAGIDINKYVENAINEIISKSLQHKEVKPKVAKEEVGKTRQVIKYDPREAVQYALKFGVDAAIDMYFRVPGRSDKSISRDKAALRKIVRFLRKKDEYELLGDRYTRSYYIMVFKRRGVNEYYVSLLGINKPYIVDMSDSREQLIRRVSKFGADVVRFVRDVTEPVLEVKEVNMDKVKEEMQAIRESLK